MVSQKIKNVGLKELGNCYYYFKPYAITVTICISESHISFHSWAKERYATLDVFVCNYKNNNT